MDLHKVGNAFQVHTFDVSVNYAGIVDFRKTFYYLTNDCDNILLLKPTCLGVHLLFLSDFKVLSFNLNRC